MASTVHDDGEYLTYWYMRASLPFARSKRYLVCHFWQMALEPVIYVEIEKEKWAKLLCCIINHFISCFILENSLEMNLILNWQQMCFLTNYIGTVMWIWGESLKSNVSDKILKAFFLKIKLYFNFFYLVYSIKYFNNNL